MLFKSSSLPWLEAQSRFTAVVLFALEWLIFHAVVFLHVKQNNLQCSSGSIESCSTDIFGWKCRCLSLPSPSDSLDGLRLEPESYSPLI